MVSLSQLKFSKWRSTEWCAPFEHSIPVNVLYTFRINHKQTGNSFPLNFQSGGCLNSERPIHLRFNERWLLFEINSTVFLWLLFTDRISWCFDYLLLVVLVRFWIRYPSVLLVQLRDSNKTVFEFDGKSIDSTLNHFFDGFPICIAILDDRPLETSTTVKLCVEWSFKLFCRLEMTRATVYLPLEMFAALIDCDYSGTWCCRITVTFSSSSLISLDDN